MASTSNAAASTAGNTIDTSAQSTTTSGVEMNTLQSLPPIEHSEPLTLPGVTAAESTAQEPSSISTVPTSSPQEPIPVAVTGSTPAPAEFESTKSQNAPGYEPAVAVQDERIEPSKAEALNPISTATNEPQLELTLLWTTTGQRNIMKIDGKYLQRRNVEVEGMDPSNISVYQLKDLILTGWREEWETRPTSPTSIRLIHMGRMLDNNLMLKDCKLGSSSVLHMNVIPQEIVDEDDHTKGGSGRGRGEERTPGCRCIIM